MKADDPSLPIKYLAVLAALVFTAGCFSTSFALSGESRDNTPFVLTPFAEGDVVFESKSASVDLSHTQQGYLIAQYLGSNSNVKLLLTGPDGCTSRYPLKQNDQAVIPLASGSGTYTVDIYEHVSGDSYSSALRTEVEVALSDDFLPFLQPSMMVSYCAESPAVEKAARLTASAASEPEVIESLYNYVVENISYDQKKADSGLPEGYLCDVDETLLSGKGICIDYASLLTAMLRSQRIPAKLQVGYAQEAYHAWVSVYSKEDGVVNNMIRVQGDSWTLLDPTFAANSSEKSLRRFLGDGSNYSVQYTY